MQSLENHFLVAMPNLDDPMFKRTVIYVCEHNEEGAMGLIVNQTIDVNVSNLLSRISIDHDEHHPAATDTIFNGGPVQTDRGFVLHTPIPGKKWSSSLNLSDELSVTTSKDILEQLTTKQSPEKFMIVLGYANWSPGQLEQELTENSWLTIPATTGLIFDIPPNLRWETAVQQLGINTWQLSSAVGHA